MDRDYYFHRYLEIIHDQNLLEGDDPPVPPEDRHVAVLGLAQARATHTAQLLFNLFPGVVMTKDRLEEVTKIGIEAMVQQFRLYLPKEPGE